MSQNGDAHASGPASASGLALFSLFLLFVFGGACIQSLPAAAPTILLSWDASPLALAGPMSLGAFGAGCGTLAGGLLGDTWGRRATTITFALVHAAAIFAASFASNAVELGVASFAAGVGFTGWHTPALALLTELTPPRRRGLMVSLAVMCGPIGMTACSMLAARIIPTMGWPALFLASSSLIIPLGLALVFFLPESPTLLERRAARRLQRQSPEPSRPARPAPVAQFFTGRLLARSAMLWIIFASIFVLGGSALSWVPVIMSRLQFSAEFATSSMSAWTSAAMVGTPFAGWCIGRFGVLKTAQCLSAGASIVFATAAFAGLDPANGTLPAIALLAAAGFFISGVITSAFVIATELYSVEVRATGIGVADAIGRTGGVVGPFVGVYAMNQGATGFFGMLMGLAVLILFALLSLDRLRAEPVPSAAQASSPAPSQLRQIEQ